MKLNEHDTVRVGHPKPRKKFYAKGRRFEYEVRKILEARGYVATRSAGSHSPWDISAVKLNERSASSVITENVLFVQAKAFKAKPSYSDIRKDVEALKRLSNTMNVCFEIWVKLNGKIKIWQIWPRMDFKKKWSEWKP